MSDSIWSVALSGPERDILRCVAEGLDQTPAIAERLGRDSRAIALELDRLLHKLRVASLAELAGYVRRSPPPLK